MLTLILLAVISIDPLPPTAPVLRSALPPTAPDLAPQVEQKPVLTPSPTPKSLPRKEADAGTTKPITALFHRVEPAGHDEPSGNPAGKPKEGSRLEYGKGGLLIVERVPGYIPDAESPVGDAAPASCPCGPACPCAAKNSPVGEKVKAAEPATGWVPPVKAEPTEGRYTAADGRTIVWSNKGGTLEWHAEGRWEIQLVPCVGRRGCSSTYQYVWVQG